MQKCFTCKSTKYAEKARKNVKNCDFKWLVLTNEKGGAECHFRRNLFFAVKHANFPDYTKVSSNLLTTTTCVPEVFFYRLNKMENNSAGNTVSRRRAASGKLPFLMFCDKEILYHGFLCFTTIMVTVTQATVLNFFIIAFFRGYYHQVSFGKKKFFSIFLTLYF